MPTDDQDDVGGRAVIRRRRDGPAGGVAGTRLRGSASDLVAAGTLPCAWAARWATRRRAPILAGPDGRWVSATELEERTAAVAARCTAAGLRPATGSW